MALFIERPEWQFRAKCRGADVSAFFPERGDAVSFGDSKHGYRGPTICVGCPVKGACLDFALRLNIKEGWWGGQSPRQRRALRHFPPYCDLPLVRHSPFERGEQSERRDIRRATAWDVFT